MKTTLKKLAILSNQLILLKADEQIPESTIPSILQFQISLENKIISTINLLSVHSIPQLRFYGSWIIALADKIFYRIPLTDQKDSNNEYVWSKNEALKQIIRVLDSSLMLLKDSGKPFFDETLKIPDYLLASKIPALKTQYVVVHESLKKQGLPDILLDILSDYFNSFSHPQEKQFSFRDINYAFKLLRGLRRTRPHEDPACMISGLLVYLNFNKVSILDFCKGWMKQIVSQGEGFEQLYTRLTELRKEVYVQEQNPHWSYDPEHISLKDHLQLLLEAELIHLENMEQKKHQLEAIENNDFFILDTTVKQLDLWVDINVKLKQIPNHSTLQVLKVITKYIRTPKSGVITYDSARKKLSEIDDASVKGLHQSLSLQRNYLEKKYPHLF